MKILIDARFYGTENTGPGRYTMNLLDELQNIDHTNHYIILLRKKYFDELIFPENFQKVLANIPHYSFKEQIEIPKIVKKYNPDLTHFLFFNVPLRFKGKFVVTIHDMTMHKQSTRSSNLLMPIYYAKHFVYKKVFKHAVVASQKIIVPSEFVKSELVKSFKIKKEKVEVICEGVPNISHFKNPLLRRGFKKPASRKFFDDNLLNIPYFLYVGNAYPHKNLERAIKAAAHLKVNLYIVSKKNKFTERLAKLTSKLNAQEYVKFLGYVEDEKLKELYEKSVGFIYPSLTEGFGLPGLEAMKAGTIVLCSDIPVFQEIYREATSSAYGNHAFFFNPLNLDSIEGAMNVVLSLSKRERDKIIRSNRIFVKRYSWEKMAKETLEIYSQFN